MSRTIKSLKVEGYSHREHRSKRKRVPWNKIKQNGGFKKKIKLRKIEENNSYEKYL